MVNPIQERIQRWSEKKFQKNLFLLRDDLPEVVRDMRETASLGEMLEEILARIERGVRSVRSAAIVDGSVLKTRDVGVPEVENWRLAQRRILRATFANPPTGCFRCACRSSRAPTTRSRSDSCWSVRGPTGRSRASEEQKALAGVSEAIARAIRTVIKREAREEKVAELIESNARRIAELEALLGGGSRCRASVGRARHDLRRRLFQLD